MTSTMKPIGIILAFSLGLIVIFFGAVTFIDVILAPIADLTGWDWLTEVSPVFLTLLCVLVLPGRWTAIPMTYQIHATTEIDANVADVWDMISPRTRDSYWGATITHTVVDPENPDQIDFHFEGTESIGSPAVLHCEIVADEPQTYFAFRPLNADQFPLFAGDVVLSEYRLEDLGERTCVTLVENLDRLRLVAIPLLIWMNPCRDALVRMKALAEGVPDTSWMGKTTAQMRGDAAEQTLSTYTVFKWAALAMIPLAFTLFLISFIGN